MPETFVGIGSNAAPVAALRAAVAALRGTYQLIEGAGHYPQTEMPEVTAPLILSFLQSLSERNSSTASRLARRRVADTARAER